MSGAKITLITPPYDRIAPGFEFVRHVTNWSPSLGLLHLAAEVRRYGYRPSIVESDIFGLSIRDVADRVIDEQPPYVGITLFTVGVRGAAAIARRIKAACPRTVVIVGGPHVSSMGSETMMRFREFDVAVVGEGEEPLVRLLNALESGDDLQTVPGILYMEGDEVRSTPALPHNQDLDHLPLPAWDILPGFPSAYPPAIYDCPTHPVATIAASRGCPFHCRFCDTSTFGARVRAYSPERMIEILQELQARYRIRHVMFVDDLFLASRRRAQRFCELILQNGMNLTWSCAARVDRVRPDLLALMKKAGCWQISFGLESGSDEQLKRMGKLAEVEKSEQAIRWAAEAGIRVKGLFMLGFPGETEETIRATEEFIGRVPMTIMNLSKFTPYPGSPIYRDLYGTSIRDDHWQKMNGMNFLWDSEEMTVEQLDRHYRAILNGFYMRPKMLWYYLTLTIRHPAHIVRLSRFLLHFAWAKTRSILRGRGGILLERDPVHLDPAD
jgi:radical SAM superfamily enzyme YgiQ (UPF0313 family)